MVDIMQFILILVVMEGQVLTINNISNYYCLRNIIVWKVLLVCDFVMWYLCMV